MGLFTDLFSTKPAEEAAAAKKAGLQQGYDALSGAYGDANTALTTNLGAGRDALASNIGAGTDALNSNSAAGRGAISSGAGAARDAINSGYGDASGLYQPLLASTASGARAYGDATGANGADGIARAGDQFKTITGYNGGLDTGIDATNRLAAAHGGFGSGNNSADVIKFASDYDNNHYKDYVSSLAPYLGANASATSGAAGLDTARGTALGGIDTAEGGALNSNYGALGSGVNADYSALGSGLNANYGAQGSSVAANDVGKGVAANANYTGQGNATADAALAPYSASSNFWNGLMGVAKLGVSAFTGTPSGGGVPGSAVSGTFGPSSYGGPSGPAPLVS